MWDTIQFFYLPFKKLITDVAEKTEMSVSYVQRVLEGDRKPNRQIVEALVAEFRERIAGKSIDRNFHKLL